MFFIIGIGDRRKDLDFGQPGICAGCGRYGRYRAYMVCTALSLFFVPCLKWNRRYYVQSDCCGSVFELDAELGRRIEAGETPEIRPEHLKPAGGRRWAKRCADCGYTTNEDHTFCPKCGRRF